MDRNLVKDCYDAKMLRKKQVFFDDVIWHEKGESVDHQSHFHFTIESSSAGQWALTNGEQT